MLLSSHDYVALICRSKIVADVTTRQSNILVITRIVYHRRYGGFCHIVYTIEERVSILVPKASRLCLEKKEVVPRIPVISLRLCIPSCLCAAIHRAELSRH